MAIIAINGRIGSGKDTVARMMQRIDLVKQVENNSFLSFHSIPSLNDVIGNMGINGSRWEIKKFAGKLKETASLLTGVPIQSFESQEFKRQLMPPQWIDEDGNRLTYRLFLQRLGTDAVRNNICDNTWVNALFADFKKPFEIAIQNTGGYSNSLSPMKYPNWIITDCRFTNEADAVKEHGGYNIRVFRDSTNGRENEHVSETALDGYEFDYVIENNGTLEELEKEVVKMMEHFKLL